MRVSIYSMSERIFVHHEKSENLLRSSLFARIFNPHNVNKVCNFPQGSGAAAQFRNYLTSDEDYMNN